MNPLESHHLLYLSYSYDSPGPRQTFLNAHLVSVAAGMSGLTQLVTLFLTMTSSTCCWGYHGLRMLPGVGCGTAVGQIITVNEDDGFVLDNKRKLAL